MVTFLLKGTQKKSLFPSTQPNFTLRNSLWWWVTSNHLPDTEGHQGTSSSLSPGHKLRVHLSLASHCSHLSCAVLPPQYYWYERHVIASIVFKPDVSSSSRRLPWGVSSFLAAFWSAQNWKCSGFPAGIRGVEKQKLYLSNLNKYKKNDDGLGRVKGEPGRGRSFGNWGF